MKHADLFLIIVAAALLAFIVGYFGNLPMGGVGD